MIEIVIKAAKEAGKVLMSYYGGDINVRSKGQYFDAPNLVTDADIESEKKIVWILEKEFPKHNIYSEEEIRKTNNSEYTWYIDPLDGTSNFSRNIPLFGVSIGLIKDSQSELGVLYFPALELLVHAEKEKGAFANEKRIKVSDRRLNEALYYAGGYNKGKSRIKQNISKKVGLTKIIDASSFEFAQIAMGDAELYVLESVPHDIVAGVVIVREAGGKVTDYSGLEWNINSKGVVASNGKIHNDVIRLLAC